MHEEIAIIPYQTKYQPAFRQLNLEWLDKFHLTEDHDLETLDDPQRMILDPGGFLWLAQAGDEIIGSAGLIKEQEGIFQLAKMSVAPDWRGKGISKLLLDVCISKARELGLRKLILFSNHQLVTAIGLYEKYGFRHVELTGTPFETADVKMELEL